MFKKGRLAAILHSLIDDKLMDPILRRSPKMRTILDQAWRDIEAGRGLEHDDFWRQFDPEISFKNQSP